MSAPKPLEDFLAHVLDSCVNGSSGSAYAAGIRDDAAEVEQGRSVEHRYTCRYCGRTTRHRLTDGACSTCISIWEGEVPMSKVIGDE